MKRLTYKLFLCVLIGLLQIEIIYANETEAKYLTMEGCKKGAATLSSKAVELEQYVVQGINATKPNSKERNQHEITILEWMEKEKDDFYSSRAKVIQEFKNSSEAKSMSYYVRIENEAAKNLYLDGIEGSMNAMHSLVISRVKKTQLGASADRYQRLIFDECFRIFNSRR